MATLLVFNFILNVAESEVQMTPDAARILDMIDLAFTIFYVVELILNLFVNWCGFLFDVVVLFVYSRVGSRLIGQISRPEWVKFAQWLSCKCRSAMHP